MQIAVLDADATERVLVGTLLEKSGFDCGSFDTPEALRTAMQARHYDAVVVDCRGDGGEAIRTAGSSGRHVATLAMIDGGDEDDIIEALSAGADDYLIKPIRPSELVARLQAMLRRHSPHETLERFDFAPFTFVADACEVHVSEQEQSRRIALTQKEFDLGLTLFRNAGRPLSRNHLRELVWGGDADVSSRTMDTHVSRLRTKLALGPVTGYRVLPVYGYGYRLDRLES